MRDPRLDKLADVLVQHCTAVRKGELVTIVAVPGALPGVEPVFEAVLRAGGHPSFHPHREWLQEALLRHGSDEQIGHVSPFEEYRLNHCDVYIVLMCPGNTRFLSGIDPRKVALAQSARRTLMKITMQRAAEGKLRWSATEIPGNAAAQDADMSLTDYEDFVFRAGFLHLADPVGAWRDLGRQHDRAIEFLSRRQTLHFRAPAGEDARGRRHDGTDLMVDLSGRTWVSCAARENFPDGEIFSGPRSVEGVVNFTYPAVFAGREFDGIRLKFRDGRVVEASATKNEAALIALLDQDPGARVAGEIAIGTNYYLTRYVKNAFFDEKLGGTFHLAVGAGYPETGNTNESGLHWDLVCDLRPGGAYPGSPGGTIHADGELIHQDGRFVRDGWPGR